MDLKRIGLQIKFHRQSAGMTQKVLAEKIGTTWEMVSRYETGKSSPFRKIPEIADALNIDLATLLGEVSIKDRGQSYTRSSIPFLNRSFSNLDEAIAKTKLYYTAPDWITKSCSRPYAIDTNIVKLETEKVSRDGVIFISAEKPESSQDLTLYHNGERLVLTSFGSLPTPRKALGTVVAHEQRFR